MPTVWERHRNITALALFILSFMVLVTLWDMGVKARIFSELIPSPFDTAKEFWRWVSNPFYDNGPNDKGIGWLVLFSLRRVCLGFLIGVSIAIPVGVLMGLSEVVDKALNPYVQVLRPVSPLAWLPLGLGLLKDSEATALFVITITSMWPTLLNTRFGVSTVDKSYLDVTRFLGASFWRTITRVILPAAAPNIVAGMRIGFGIAWLVIVAAEIIIGNLGMGYFVWNEWNNLSITSLITGIIVIGFVGLLFDRLFALLQSWVAYGRQV
ncbi:MAG: ABC transporter permease [Gloeomargarita sp. SKYBB_i_bin120]|nr:ABC transporter permease [Gloeomargarita sp. SKYG98]MCS7292421.1 ABC transporter permease [Gloeomargarita sp. SKYB120]MDW8177982.1 ABC transporter permease [Gloeomargarita sp. SKYBB_i_bin120]